LFVEPVSESDTIEDIVYECLLKSRKNLNIHIEKENSLCGTNHSELILLLEEVTHKVIDAVISEKSNKDFELDKLFNGKDQLKTNNVLGMKDVGIEFNTIYQCLKR
jgi:adenine-specific DNA-methyltransferase